MSVFVDFEPVGRRGECEAGGSLLECARSLGVEMVNICGGEGSCGSCIVQIVSGVVSPIVAVEREYLNERKLTEGYRLACFTIPLGNCKVRIPPESITSPQRAQVEGRETPTKPDPTVQSFRVILSPPTIEDQRSDADRLLNKLSERTNLQNLVIDFEVLSELSNILRENDFDVNILVRGVEVVSMLPGRSNPLGLAVDLGTTKIAAYLMDLETGTTLSSQGLMNPQIAYGEDIITRIASTLKDPDNAKCLQRIVVEVLNKTINEMCAEVGRQVDEIIEIVVVGNTAMHHLFLGLPVKQLGRAPYIPVVSSALDVKAREIDVTGAPGANIHLLPNIAGYVGADHVAMLLANDILEKSGVFLAIDIGTNTEICLANNGELTSLSTASGPAFEGAHIKHGMRAANGAIERLLFTDDEIRFQTIGGVSPVGLCGSGILDVVALLLNAGIINKRGKMANHPSVRASEDSKEFIIVDRGDENNISFNQNDVEQIQLAKGAIRTGINVLLRTANLDPEDIDQIMLAGAFGTYLDVRSAIAIGMLPDIPVERVQQVGNAAGMGAKLALISRSKREQAKTIASQVRYIELAADPHFSRTFARAMYLGKI